ncbi:invasion associated locus B family protein [Ensifer sp. ENS11]|uniref:invasion associated locus B family protein n=1 Tax=Ensifer sp. ENS11 TaxID=2769291 RepID=UPI00046CBE59|nr:invasion associated locus B family protein [Ensifer sp. ENS11]
MRQCLSSWFRSNRTIFATFCLVVLAIGETFAQEHAPLPGGASSLQETYADWIVSCVQRKNRHCLLMQQQTQQNGQRLLAIEMAAGGDGKTATGTLVLPFGLALDAGVSLQVDERSSEAPVRFSTCLPAGCVVPLSFDGAALAELRTGAVLKMMAKANNTNEPISLSASLKGFSAALDRVTALMK